MKIAVFGGAFNPVHNGHVMLCNEFCKAIGFDKVLLVPSSISPHKSNDNLALAEHRVNMLKLVLNEIENAEICMLELEREGKSYTALTLQQLRQIYENDELYLICGADMFLTVDRWYRPDIIFENAIICGACRDEFDEEKMNEQAKRIEKMGAKTIVLAKYISPLSSTKIRDMLEQGNDCSALLPNGVYDYIMSNGLYV